MAKLDAKQRAKLPARDFGLPEKARSEDAKKETGNYPIPDEGHAISAKRLAAKQRKDGNSPRTSSSGSIARPIRSSSPTPTDPLAQRCRARWDVRRRPVGFVGILRT